jgi:hypothetical protein
MGKSVSLMAGRSVRILSAAAVAVAAVASTPKPSLADQGGISFWLPGQFGSLAAAPGQPGWSAASIYYHASVGAGGDVAASREATIGRFNPNVNVNLNANLNARVDLVLLNATYVFATPVLGGQLALGMTGLIGRNSTSIDGTLTASVGGLTTTRSGSISDSRGGVGDLYPMASLKWNQGVNNYMFYLTGDIPVGTYDSSRLANFGVGHGAIDGGAGYTYFNPQTGHELSVVSGLTYNFKNTDTDYQNGINWHVDWGLSQFLSKQLFVGAAGYFYHQISDDGGAPAILGDFRSRVIAIGPQIGYLFPAGNVQGYLNLKGYYEFGTEHRPAGWNTWLTLAISPAAQAPSSTQTKLVRK